MFPRKIIHCKALPHQTTILSTLAQFSTPVCQVALSSLNASICFLSFNYTNTLDRTVHSHFADFLFRLTPFRTWYTGTPSYVLLGGLGAKEDRQKLGKGCVALSVPSIKLCCFCTKPILPVAFIGYYTNRSMFL